MTRRRGVRVRWTAVAVVIACGAFGGEAHAAKKTCDGPVENVAAETAQIKEGREVTCTFAQDGSSAAVAMLKPQAAAGFRLIVVGGAGQAGSPGMRPDGGPCCGQEEGGSGGPGGPGARIVSGVPIPAGGTVWISVPQFFEPRPPSSIFGPDFDPAPRGGGAGGKGYFSGQKCSGHCGGDGGQGGAASIVSRDQALTDPVIIAAGGGGGGGGGACDCSPGSFGGFAGAPGGDAPGADGGRTNFTGDGRGQNGQSGHDSVDTVRYVGGGGGGGGGLRGGGGGDGGFFDGGAGGGGGSNLAPEGASEHVQVPAVAPFVEASFTYDLKPPQTSIVGTPYSTNGWYSDTVQPLVTASDPGSGVAETRCVLDPVTAPASFDDLPAGPCEWVPKFTFGPVISAEGEHTLYAASRDNFGRKEAVRSAEFNIDRKAPTITAAVTSQPNPSGWYRGDVTVRFTCSDQGGGLEEGVCPEDEVLTGEGADVRSTAVTVVDRAGNRSAPANVVSVKIDRTAPAPEPELSGTEGANGWYQSDVTVAWKWKDAGSGIVDAMCRPSSRAQGEGPYIVVIESCTDAAGNTGGAQQAVKIDRTAPASSPEVDGVAGDSGWYRSTGTIRWGWTDATSGLDPASCDTKTDWTQEGAAVELDSACRDQAGNRATDSRTLKVDYTPPGADPGVTGQKGDDGWYLSDVDVDWGWKDGVSGVDSARCTPATTASEDGDAVTTTAGCTDVAGNHTTTSRSFKIDTVAPRSAPAASGQEGKAGWYVSDVTVDWNWADDTSGLRDSCAGQSVTDGEGEEVWVATTCRDVAGNSTSDERAFRIDQTAPQEHPVVTGEEGDDGWYVSDVDVDWGWRDEVSGVDEEGCTPATTAADDGHAVTTTADCTDVAGNAAVAERSFKIDTVAPRSAPVVSGEEGEAGWYVSDVTVEWNWADDTSGLRDSCADRSVTDGEGEAVSVATTCRDVAGNSASDDRAFPIDQTAPSLDPSVTPDPVILRTPDASASPNAKDATSGVAASSCAPLDASSTGGKFVRCEAVDVAGHRASVNHPYTVVHRIVMEVRSELLVSDTVYAGSGAQVRAVLTDALGIQIPRAEAAQLGKACRVTFRVSGAQTLAPKCMQHESLEDAFRYHWHVGEQSGDATASVEVSYPGATNPAAHRASQQVAIQPRMLCPRCLAP